MKRVEPKVFFLGEFHLDRSGVRDWLHEIGGNEALECLAYTTGSDVEQLIELMARRCYKSFAPGLNPNVSKVRTDSDDFHTNLIKSRHGSVTAHGHCTFAFENVSRVFTHELVRNWVGTERSQESLRYVRLDELRFWVPPVIEAAKEKVGMTPPPCSFEAAYGDQWQVHPLSIFEHVIETCEWGQQALSAYYGLDDDVLTFDQKKKLTSAFRRIAPIGLATGIGVTFNIRALRWIIEQRTHRSAEEEIRMVFGMVMDIARVRWPMMFQDFEGTMVEGCMEWVPEHSKI